MLHQLFYTLTRLDAVEAALIAIMVITVVALMTAIVVLVLVFRNDPPFWWMRFRNKIHDAVWRMQIRYDGIHRSWHKKR